MRLVACCLDGPRGHDNGVAGGDRLSVIHLSNTQLLGCFSAPELAIYSA